MRFVLCDLDGVVWLAHEPIAGAASAVEQLRSAGLRVLFVTNNSRPVLAEHEVALADHGIAAVGDVVTSAQAAASLVEPGEAVHLCAGPGVAEAVDERGARVVDPAADADVVIVGMHHGFDYDGLAAASRAIRSGARFIATNDDATYPTPGGPTPGTGSLVAAVSVASGVAPTIAGKPHLPMADLTRARCGPDFSGRTALMVGDRWSTDGEFAEHLGCPFALVRSGVTTTGARVGGEPDIDAPDLAAVASILLDGRSRPDVHASP